MTIYTSSLELSQCRPRNRPVYKLETIYAIYIWIIRHIRSARFDIYDRI